MKIKRLAAVLGAVIIVMALFAIVTPSVSAVNFEFGDEWQQWDEGEGTKDEPLPEDSPAPTPSEEPTPPAPAPEQENSETTDQSDSSSGRLPRWFWPVCICLFLWIVWCTLRVCTAKKRDYSSKAKPKKPERSSKTKPPLFDDLSIGDD